MRAFWNFCQNVPPLILINGLENLADEIPCAYVTGRGQITVVDLDTQLEMARAELKKYNYVVTENNYKDAKKDRADLNKLVKQVSDARKSFENKAFDKWKTDRVYRSVCFSPIWYISLLRKFRYLKK